MNSQTKDQPLASTIDALRLAATVQALAILLVAVVLLAGGWLAVLVTESIDLGDALQAQHRKVQSARQVRDGLDALATGVQQLAREGNVNAKAALDELSRQGIALSLNAKPDAGVPGR